ncbi:uncharacterized protein At2g39795, mitochondrial-like [Amaranthus tricolor]|uniref:uncharacterized protein At2g39795, mitochondrial-like n=1 Tax=Amaranthus tricolor TaxID=29722 RepID=UPI0025887499|nr:uncharacterized protein At2g39795, mitochondrial-like [Amaranthus tricolor]
MAFSAIIRRSAIPIASRVIGSQIQSPAAVKRAAFFTHFVRSTLCSSFRRFSSDVATSSDRKLLEVLQSEISVVEESEDYDKTVEAPSGFPFKIKDNVGEQTVTLTREYEGETITVEVSMPSLVTDEDEEESGNEDDEKSTASSVPLLVTVAKKNGPSLEFDCIAYPDEISINNLALKNPESDEQLAYEGPDFMDLDENLQRSFHKYLEIRGIKPSTTNFLHEYMMEKDNKEYYRWLKDVKKFVEA